jgi:hypothetical protein
MPSEPSFVTLKIDLFIRFDYKYLIIVLFPFDLKHGYKKARHTNFYYALSKNIHMSSFQMKEGFDYKYLRSLKLIHFHFIY